VVEGSAYDAVILAGGTARRLGGVDKPGLVVGGRTLLDRVLAAVDGAARVVVVGPQRPTSRPVMWCREEQPGAGPVAALAAGLSQVTAERVLLLAGDLPFLTAATVQVLVDAIGVGVGALLVDDAGRDQLLLGAWRTAELRAALPAEPAGVALRAVLEPLRPGRVSLAVDLGTPAPWFDCDTDSDLALAREAT
jgi:molybdopterin-guanine dinucleotide biosynthesis protein A